MLHVMNDANSKPITYVNAGGFPFNGNVEGSLQLRNVA